MTRPSTYSHDPTSGQRVAQYAPIAPPVGPQQPRLRTGGYTHTRSTLSFGPSLDQYHRVEQWGEPVRPYGEWQFPFRPYSTPYPNWGPPYAGLGGFGFGYGFGPGFPGTGLPGVGNPGLVTPYPTQPEWWEGPDARLRGPQRRGYPPYGGRGPRPTPPIGSPADPGTPAAP
ncbi:MAG: hypothetical protein AAGD07_12450 [Planctomycetota bacterium]